MKILHVSFSLDGGAGIGLKRLHKALIKKKINSHLFIYEDYTKKNYLLFWKFLILFKKIIKKFFLLSNSKETISLNLFDNLKLNYYIKRNKIDIVHLHWVGNEMLSIKDISKLKVKSIIWTMHDMWPFIGAEHFSYDNNYQLGYKEKTFNKYFWKINFNKIIYRQKQKYFNNKKILIICPSKWIMKKLQRSSIFKKNKKIILPYLIDSDEWKLKKKSYKSLNKKKRILFIATSSIDYRKGFNYLFFALKNYLDNNKYILNVVGFEPKLFKNIDFVEKNYLGYFKSEKKLKQIYLSNDIIVIPSLVESFGQIFTEAGLLGIPGVAFDKTAVTDILSHKKNGYLSKFKSSKDLAKGIKWCTNRIDNNSLLGHQIRNTVIKKFSTAKNINKYIELYKSQIL